MTLDALILRHQILDNIKRCYTHCCRAINQWLTKQLEIEKFRLDSVDHIDTN
jgi:hypothetical protein